jgi:hypothetical protein
VVISHFEAPKSAAEGDLLIKRSAKRTALTWQAVPAGPMIRELP